MLNDRIFHRTITRGIEFYGFEYELVVRYSTDDVYVWIVCVQALPTSKWLIYNDYAIFTINNVYDSSPQHF